VTITAPHAIRRESKCDYERTKRREDGMEDRMDLNRNVCTVLSESRAALERMVVE